MYWSSEVERLERQPSAAEKRIMDFLNKKCVDYCREVKFEGLISDKGFPLYFDFYLPDKNLVIEYDGPHHEDHLPTIHNDRIKNKFCYDNHIRIRRLNKLDWKFLEAKLGQILGRVSVLTPGKKMPSKYREGKKERERKRHDRNFKKIVSAYRK